MTPTARALKQAATKDEALRVRDAAIASLAGRYKPDGKRFKKFSARVDKSYRARVSEIDKAIATASATPSGVVLGSPAGSTNSGSAPPPIRQNLAPTISAASGDDDGGSSIILWLGIGAIVWWFWKGR